MSPLTLGDFTVPKFDPEKARQEIDRRSLAHSRPMPYRQPTLKPGYGGPILGQGTPLVIPWWLSPGSGGLTDQPGIGTPHPLVFSTQPGQEDSIIPSEIPYYFDKATNSAVKRARDAVGGIVPDSVSREYRTKAQDLVEGLIRDKAGQYHPNQWSTIAAEKVKGIFGPWETLPGDFDPDLSPADRARWLMNQSAQQNRGGPNTRHPLFPLGQPSIAPPTVPPRRGPLDKYLRGLPDFRLEWSYRF